MKKAYVNNNLELTTVYTGATLTISSSMDIHSITLETNGGTEGYYTMDSELIDTIEREIGNFHQWIEMSEEEGNDYILSLSKEWGINIEEIGYLI